MDEDKEPVPPVETEDELQGQDQQQVPQEVNNEIHEQQERDQQQVPRETSDEVQEQQEQDQRQVPPETNDEVQEQQEQDQQKVPEETNDDVHEQQEQDQHQDPQEVHDEVQEQQRQVQQQVPQELNDEIQEQDQQQVPAGINDEIQQQQEQQQQEQEEQAPFPPKFVYHEPSKVEFHIKEIMGKSDNGVITVYKAACAFREGTKPKLHSEVFAALKLARPVQGSQELNILSLRLRRSLQLPKYNYPHRNLVGTECFFRDNGICCVVFYYMDGSLRSLLRSKLHNGIHKEYVLMILKEALKGLCCIHDNNLVHGEISAGQIFYEFGTIKLSFAATVYDHGTDDDDDPAYLPVKSISTWASAPEVYGSQDAGLNNPKTDIWMIGITALELAFGEAQIRDRDHFMSIVNKITKEHGPLPLKDKRSLFPWKKALSWFDRSKLINTFEKFVCKCLAAEPENRPTAHELLDSELFSKTTTDSKALHKLFSS